MLIFPSSFYEHSRQNLPKSTFSAINQNYKSLWVKIIIHEGCPRGLKKLMIIFCKQLQLPSIILDRNDSHIVIQFQVFLPNINNFITNRFDAEIGLFVLRHVNPSCVLKLLFMKVEYNRSQGQMICSENSYCFQINKFYRIALQTGLELPSLRVAIDIYIYILCK